MRGVGERSERRVGEGRKKRKEGRGGLAGSHAELGEVLLMLGRPRRPQRSERHASWARALERLNPSSFPHDTHDQSGAQVRRKHAKRERGALVRAGAAGGLGPRRARAAQNAWKRGNDDLVFIFDWSCTLDVARPPEAKTYRAGVAIFAILHGRELVIHPDEKCGGTEPDDDSKRRENRGVSKFVSDAGGIGKL